MRRGVFFHAVNELSKLPRQRFFFALAVRAEKGRTITPRHFHKKRSIATRVVYGVPLQYGRAAVAGEVKNVGYQIGRGKYLTEALFFFHAFFACSGN